MSTATATAPEVDRSFVVHDPANEVLYSPGMLMLRDSAELVMPPHLRELDEAIVVACRASEQRFLLNVEPIRHGKSVLATAYTAAWYLLNFPERSVLILCYNAELASEFGEQVRDILRRQGEAFGITVSHSSSAKNRFRLVVNGRLMGGLRAVGMNGALTGRGFHLVLADDMIKGREEADSKAARNKVWNRFVSTVRTRLDVKVGTVIVTNSRWHADDIVGRITEAMSNPDADQYVTLHRPALALRPAKVPDVCPYTIDGGGCARTKWIRRYRPGWECDGHWHAEDGRAHGEALWPERYSARALARLRASISDREFAAQLQGQPVLAGAGTVRTDAVRFIDRLPAKGLRWVWAWDRALSDTGDYTAGVLLARNAKGQVVIAHACRIRTADPDERDKFMVSEMLRNGPRSCTVIVETEGSEGKASARYLRRRLGRRPFVLQRPPTDRSKIQRGEPFFAAINASAVFVLRHGSVVPAWWHDLRDELDAVPVGTHDDMWDAAATGFNYLDRATGSRLSAPA